MFRISFGRCLDVVVTVTVVSVLMTQAALDGANPVILTSDNPRTEDPEQIFADMKQGIDFFRASYA